MDCIHCPQCYAYAYDTLVRPASRSRIDMFEKTINIPRIAKAAHTLTPDFIRASVTPNDLSYIVLLCVEAGGVVRVGEAEDHHQPLGAGGIRLL